MRDVHLAFGQREDQSGRRVVHHRAGDPERIDVPARQRRPGHRRADVSRPDHRTGGRIERVDGVVLGRGEDPVTDHQRLAVDRAVERRGPGRREGAQRGEIRGEAGTGVVVVVGDPVPGGGGCRHACGRLLTDGGGSGTGCGPGQHTDQADCHQRPKRPAHDALQDDAVHLRLIRITTATPSKPPDRDQQLSFTRRGEAGSLHRSARMRPLS